MSRILASRMVMTLKRATATKRVRELPKPCKEEVEGADGGPEHAAEGELHDIVEIGEEDAPHAGEGMPRLLLKLTKFLHGSRP